MKVLMLSRDLSVLDASSAAGKRMEEYKQLVDSLTVVVLNSKKGLRSLFDLYREARKLILREKDTSSLLLTAQDPFELGLVGYLLSRKYAIPLQLQIHTDFLSPYFSSESIKNKIRVWIAKHILRRVCCVRVVSERIKTSIIKNSGISEERITVLPIATSMRYNALTSSSEKEGFTFLMVSRLSREKNIFLALEAFSDIAGKFPETRLRIVGDGPESTNLKAYAETLGIASHVYFEGHKEDVAHYLASADCFLLTSNYEGYGMSVVEALSAGVPIIMTNVGIAGSLVRNAIEGFVVPVGDRIALRSSMERIIQHTAEREEYAKNAKVASSTVPSKEEYLRMYKSHWEDCLMKCQ